MAAKGNIIIIGAGPSGIGCAHTLAKASHAPVVIDEEGEAGGLCRTLNFHGYLFDIGGHRFISKSEEINDLWHDILGGDMLRVKRLSRIYYRKRYFKYPLSFFNTFINLGPIESFLCICSYLHCKRARPGDDSVFEGWVINRFGSRLYDIFFKSYTEKVWSVSCKNISADWARQRIRGLSLKVAVRTALLGVMRKAPKTLSEEFLYPRMGPGELYKRFSDRISSLGGAFKFNRMVTAVNHKGGRITSLTVKDLRSGKEEEIGVDYLFSSMALPALISSLRPRPPRDILHKAGSLLFRGFVVVNVILDKEDVFPDQWIYVHSPEVKLGRIQNYKNWSPGMVANIKRTSLGLEYFCTEGDRIWEMNDIDLIQYALEELDKVGISCRKFFINGFVIRRRNVYPVYSLDYNKKVDDIRNYLAGFGNFQTMGRAGLFRYDNSDHALLTGIYAARNFLCGGSKCDVWDINPDREYLES